MVHAFKRLKISGHYMQMFCLLFKLMISAEQIETKNPLHNTSSFNKVPHAEISVEKTMIKMHQLHLFLQWKALHLLVKILLKSLSSKNGLDALKRACQQNYWYTILLRETNIFC